jgi:serine O-acetyltransferase
VTAGEKNGNSPLKEGRSNFMQENGSSLRQFITQVGEDYRVHQRDWTLPGFQALAVHRFGVWVGSVRPRVLRGILSRLYRFAYVYVRNYYGIELPRTTKVGRRLTIGHQGGIVVHCSSRIGDDCIIRQNVTLGAASVETVQHGPTLMNRVEVGCGAVIMGKIIIENDVRIGPNAVVTTNIAAGSTVVVSPPRVIQLTRRTEPSGNGALASSNEDRATTE